MSYNSHEEDSLKFRCTVVGYKDRNGLFISMADG